MSNQTRRFPNETAAYREARDRLLQAELELRAATEKVAEQRRALPLGGAVPEDYEFVGMDGPVRLSSLFSGDHDTLIAYGFMFAPGDDLPCPMCNAFLDSLDGSVPHLARQVDVAVIAKAPIATLRDWAERRGWRHLPLYSSQANSFNADYHAENAAGAQLPTLNVFHRNDDGVFHTWSSEMMFAPGMNGGDPRHVDFAWPLWGLLDLTPKGRGDWYPAVQYD